MASWAPEMPDPNAGDDLAYAEAWEQHLANAREEGIPDEDALEGIPRDELISE